MYPLWLGLESWYCLLVEHTSRTPPSSVNIMSAGSFMGGSRSKTLGSSAHQSRCMYARHGSLIMLCHVGETHRKRMSGFMGSREKISNNMLAGNCPAPCLFTWEAVAGLILFPGPRGWPWATPKHQFFNFLDPLLWTDLNRPPSQFVVVGRWIDKVINQW
jgi:hypothetical protein